MSVTYCKSWFRAEKCATDIWSEEKALDYHQKGKLYTVVLGKLSNPKCFLEINLEELAVKVNFLDNYLRDYLLYSFQEKKPNFLFLSKVVLRKYKKETSNVCEGEMILYQPNGDVFRKTVDYTTNQTTKENIHNIDISPHWESIPDFGNYQSISRINRG